MTVEESLIQLWGSRFHEKGETIIPYFVNCDLPKRVLLFQYLKLPPIEQMPEKEKQEMKKYVIEKFPEKTKEQMVEACKIIYTFGNLL